MRILVLCYEFPPIGGGGGRVAEDLCRHFVKRGHEVLVQTSGFKGLPKREQRSGYTICRVRAPRRRRDRCTIFEMVFYVVFNIIPALGRAFIRRPDVIHCHFAVPTGFVAWIVGGVVRIPYVITAHLGDVPGGVPQQTDAVFRIIKPLTRPIWKNAAVLTAVSDHVAGLARRAYGLPVQTIVNGIEINPVESLNTIPHDPIRLIFAGRFNPQKNPLFLIAVLARIADAPWTMDLVGDGDLMPQLKDAVAKAGLQTRVRFHGWLEPDKADEIMSKCDALVLPSLYEGMPVVGVKALQFGLAIVASDIEGLTGIVMNGENGYRVPVNDAQGFEDALRIIAADKNMLRTMRRKSRSLVTAFDLSKIAAQYEAVFEKAVA
jgi:glycosyltransferase involved in cell wall biosynthesis